MRGNVDVNGTKWRGVVFVIGNFEIEFVVTNKSITFVKS